MSKVINGVVFLDRGNYTTCTVHLFGGTILSFRVRNKEILYLKKMTVFNGLSAIRGGIKFTFPYFGRRPNGPKHGFSRCVCWNLEEGPITKEDGNVEVVISMSDTEFTKSIWNFQFKFSYRLTLYVDKLTIDVKVHNTSKYFPFYFTILRHSIFHVEDVHQCEIRGLTNCRYIRLNTSSKEPIEQERDKESIKITRAYWDLFLDAPSSVELRGIDKSGIKCKISNTLKNTSGRTEAFVYNPWIECKNERDDTLHFADEYLYCVGVGNGHLSSELRLEPGESWESHHAIEVVDEENERRLKELAVLLDNPSDLFKRTCTKLDTYTDNKT